MKMLDERKLFWGEDEIDWTEDLFPVMCSGITPADIQGDHMQC